MRGFFQTAGQDDLGPTPFRSATTVLLAEDNPPIRQLMTRTLERAGYHVMIGEDGREALDLARRYRGPIHLLIADVLMPGLDGFDLLEHVLTVHPETQALMMSGYARDFLAVTGGLRHCGRPFLLKPFTQTQFLDYVTTVLSTVGCGAGHPDPRDHSKRPHLKSYSLRSELSPHDLLTPPRGGKPAPAVATRPGRQLAPQSPLLNERGARPTCAIAHTRTHAAT